MYKREPIKLTFAATPEMVDVIARILKIKSKQKGHVVTLSAYIKELMINDIQQNFTCRYRHVDETLEVMNSSSQQRMLASKE